MMEHVGATKNNMTCLMISLVMTMSRVIQSRGCYEKARDLSGSFHTIISTFVRFYFYVKNKQKI